MDHSLHPDTVLVRGGLRRTAFAETSEALFMTQGYTYPDAETAAAAFRGENDRFIYSRYANPTVGMFQDRLAALEGAEACFATASGMAAVNAALMSHLKAGARVVASRALFGSCRQILCEILPRFGVHTVLVDGRDLDAWAQALSAPTDVVFLESPSNPMLELVDIQAVARLAHQAGATVMVDNVFATPMGQRPLALGADLVIYSATKHIDGQGRALGGAILGRRQVIDEVVQPYLRHTGPSLSPFNAWVLLKGLETLALRVERQCATALTLARRLEAHPAVRRVVHPGLDSHPQRALAQAQMRSFGTVIAFELVDGAAAFRALNALRLVDLSNNLGDAKSLATHPATTTHHRIGADARAELGIGDGVIRLSVGLEHADDLWADLARALDQAGSSSPSR